MTDSDSDTTVFPFQNGQMSISAKGPNTNITNLSFRTQMPASMCMPRNFERQRQRYAESVCDQRSLNFRRETSPMSVYSACDARQRSFQQHYAGTSSQRSIFNGRSGSPMSMRSIDSTASMSASDIAFALKNGQFNKFDLRVIKEAYQKCMKETSRKRFGKRIEKRRRMLLKRRRRSGDDSGDQGSDSSISSDDCRSVKTCGNISSMRLARVDVADFRRTVQSSSMVKDCTENYRQNSFRNMFSVDMNSSNISNRITNSLPKQNMLPTQKNRFQNGFLMPSQRFNKSVASLTIPERMEKGQSLETHVHPHLTNKNSGNRNNIHPESASDEEIFTEMRNNDKLDYCNKSQGKRPMDVEEASLPTKKRSKIISPKNTLKSLKTSSEPTNNNSETSNNFEFLKPSLPVRKSKSKVQEKLIAKSAAPLTDLILPPITNDIDSPPADHIQEKQNENHSQVEQNIAQNSDLSMRPSFIKRKLFTQNLDVADKANTSSDGTNSPQQNVYSMIQKEKNKARKLVTNQSCLNREVNDDSNLLDLIHKIVPPDRINSTTVSNQNQTKNELAKKKDDSDKWDVTSVISMCDDDDVSDTYTDEEIFEGKGDKNATTKKKVKETKANENKVVKEIKTHDKMVSNVKIVANNTKASENKGANGRLKDPMCRIVLEPLNNKNFGQHLNNTKTQGAAKSFWDTDLESDAECQSSTQRLKEKLLKEILPAKNDKKNPGTLRIPDDKIIQQIRGTKEINNKTALSNSLIHNTLDSMRKFNLSSLSVRSHRAPKRKKCCNDSLSETKSKENVSTAFTNKPIVNSHFISKKQMPETNTKNNTAKNTKPNEHNNISSKSKPKTNAKEIQNKMSALSSKTNTNGEINNSLAKSKSNLDILNKKSPKSLKSNTNKNNCNNFKPKSTSQILNETSNDVEQNRTEKNKKKVESKQGKEENKDTTKPQKTNSKSNNKVDNANDKRKGNYKNQPKTKSLHPNNEKELSISPIPKTKTTSQRANRSARLKAKKDTSNSILNEEKSDRPLRSCRISKCNDSVYNSRNSNISYDDQRNLRSRVINLSSSIENITFNIKPRNKPVTAISCVNTRTSDVSFSLEGKSPLSHKKTLTSIADFCKRKRKA